MNTAPASARPAGKGIDSTEILIRPMTDEDTVTYCALFQSVFSQEPWNENWTIPQIDAIITRHRRKRGFIGMMAALPSGAIGFLTGFGLQPVPAIFYMDQLFVAAQYQGLKTGKRLLVETERLLKNRGVSLVFLLTKPRSFAERFYVKNGYTPFLRALRVKGKSIFIKYL